MNELLIVRSKINIIVKIILLIIAMDFNKETVKIF